MKLAQLHLDYARGRQGLTLYLDKQLNDNIRLSRTNKKINNENRRQDHKVYRQFWWMKRGLKTTVLRYHKIHTPDFNCGHDSGSDGLTAGQKHLQDIMLSFNLTLRVISINCHLQSLDSHHLHIYLSFIWTFTGIPKETGKYRGQDQWHIWTIRTRLANRQNWKETDQNNTSNMWEIKFTMGTVCWLQYQASKNSQMSNVTILLTS